jgi:hypothetical protein
VAIIISEPEIWPANDARSDLDNALLVLDYAQYGLEMRELLEIDGPYRLNEHAAFARWRMRLAPISPQPDPKDMRKLYDEQASMLLRNSRGQFLVYACAVFDLLIANTLIFLYIEAGNDGPDAVRPANPELAWDDAARQMFLHDPRVADIEADTWMHANGRWETVKERIKLLEQTLGVPLRTLSFDGIGKARVDWNYFLDARNLRHSVAHTAGRQVVHKSAAREHKEISQDLIDNLSTYVRGIAASINHGAYEAPILARRS